MIEVKKPELKDKLLATTITRTDYKKIQSIAKRHKMSVSGYLRALVIEQIKSELKLKLNVK